MITATDYHTAGEPFRIVTYGVPEIPGATVAERRTRAATGEADTVRRLLCHEPRGHADMCGCFLVPPDTVPPNGASAHFGVLFWHADGFPTACGHGTIALGAWAVESGQVPSTPDSETEVVLDVPSGRVVARVRRDGDAVADVTFRNVPATVLARDVPVAGVRVDLADGGARYASVPAAAFGLKVSPDHLPDLIRAGRAVKRELGEDLYGVILYEDVGPDHQRNVTVFADGQVDRSPCGSGTSARLALLADDLGYRPFTHESILGTRFTARIVGEAGGGVIAEVTGTAYRTGEHTFVLDPRDELGTGFVLR